MGAESEKSAMVSVNPIFALNQLLTYSISNLTMAYLRTLFFRALTLTVLAVSADLALEALSALYPLVPPIGRT